MENQTLKSMTPEEIEQLISYTTTTGSKIYYSKLAMISEEAILYDNIRYTSDEIDHIDLGELESGKSTYEIFIMLNAGVDVERFVRESAEETIKETLKDSINDVLTNIIEVKDNFNDALNDELTNIKKLNVESNSVLNSAAQLHFQLKDFADSVDLDTLELRIKDSVNKIKPLKTELSDTIGKLKDLLK